MPATKLTAICWAVLLLSVPAALAQKNKEPSTRSVSGIVTGPDQKPLVGAVVQLTDTKTKNVRSFYTQDNGEYHFNELSPDIDYELMAMYQGATSKTKTLSVFDSRKKPVINLQLNPKK